MADPEPFVPQSKDDWADVFALGLTKYRTQEDERQAKLAADAAATQTDKDKTPVRKRTIGELLLGVPPGQTE